MININNEIKMIMDADMAEAREWGKEIDENTALLNATFSFFQNNCYVLLKNELWKISESFYNKPGSLFSSISHNKQNLTPCEIKKETEKAVFIQNNRAGIWIPKSCIIEKISIQ